MIKAFIVGAGTYGSVYAAYLSDTYEIVGFLDDDPSKHGTSIEDISVLGNLEQLSSVSSKEEYAVFVPIGNNRIRVKILEQSRNMGFITPSFIHPSCLIHTTVTMGAAVYFLPGCNVMPYTKIGDYCMISMGVNIAHHVEMEDGCFLSQGCNIGASVHIGKLSFFGISSTLMTGVKSVGKNVLVGGGAVVIRDMPDSVVVAGVPARIIKDNH